MSGDLTLDIGGDVSRCLAVSPTFQLLSNWNYYNIYLINEAADLAIQRGLRRQISSSNARLNNRLINNKFRYSSLHEDQGILNGFAMVTEKQRPPFTRWPRSAGVTSLLMSAGKRPCALAQPVVLRHFTSLRYVRQEHSDLSPRIRHL